MMIVIMIMIQLFIIHKTKSHEAAYPRWSGKAALPLTVPYQYKNDSNANNNETRNTNDNIVHK